MRRGGKLKEKGIEGRVVIRRRGEKEAEKRGVECWVNGQRRRERSGEARNRRSREEGRRVLGRREGKWWEGKMGATRRQQKVKSGNVRNVRHVQESGEQNT